MDVSKPLHSLHRHEVETYLSANLNWSITTVCIAPPLRTTRAHGFCFISQIRGRTVPLDSMPSLTVSVAVGSAVHHHHADLLSDYSAYETLHLGTQPASVAHAASSTSTSPSASIHHDRLATTAYACSDPRSESSPPFHTSLDGANLRSYPICCR